MTWAETPRPARLADFAGEWALRRRIDDRQAGRVIAAAGRASFAPDGAGGLIHDEALSLTIPGHGVVAATRRYLWRPGAGGIRVWFADGRAFHRIALGGADAGDEHFCPPDRYCGHYDFSAWPEWRAVWTVCGPRKDYRMRTVYSRA